MALVSWNNKYSIGIEALDEQHKAFMKALNELHAAAMRGKAQEVAGPLLRQVVSLANEHFSTEERLMEASKFPGLAGHRVEHQKLSGKLSELVARHEKGDATVYTQLLQFMRDLHNQHMQSEDQEYAEWLATSGVK